MRCQSDKASLHSYEPLLRICNLNSVKGQRTRTETQTQTVSISGKWLNPYICGRSLLFVAHLPPFIPTQRRLPIIGLSQRLERRWKSHRWRFKGCREQGGSKQEQRGGSKIFLLQLPRNTTTRHCWVVFFCFCFVSYAGLSSVRWKKKSFTSGGLNSPCRFLLKINLNTLSALH